MKGRRFKNTRDIPDKRTMKPHLSLRLLAIPSAIRCLLVVLLTIFISSCAGSPPHTNAPSTAPTRMSVPQSRQQRQPHQATIEQRLRSEVRMWKGTPHRMGGTRRSGVDCSGFVQRIFNDLFDIKLPRSTASQVRTGLATPVKHLRPGDLVFFHPPNKVRHVGIYLGRGEFAHASTSRGVTISRMDASYWRNAYWTARRIPGVSG